MNESRHRGPSARLPRELSMHVAILPYDDVCVASSGLVESWEETARYHSPQCRPTTSLLWMEGYREYLLPRKVMAVIGTKQRGSPNVY